MELMFTDEGPGPVVVLLHGFPLDRSMWSYQRKTVGSMYRVVCPDLRGHGQSFAPDGIYPIDDMADDVIELLDSLKIAEPVVLGGLSMGGYVALSVAVRYPKRLRGLMLMNTRAGADKPEAAQLREEQARAIESSGDIAPLVAVMIPKLFSPSTRANQAALIDQTREVMMRTSPKGVIGSSRGMAIRPDRVADLARIKVPTLVMTGAEEAMIPVEESRIMASALPHAELVIVPEAGHMTPLEAPVAANSAILRFLGSLA